MCSSFRLGETINISLSLFRWQTWKKFDIQIRDLPKESRINVNVIGVYRSKAAKIKTGVKFSKDGEFHVILRWGNMQLLNHRYLFAYRSYPFICYTFNGLKFYYLPFVNGSHITGDG